MGTRCTILNGPQMCEQTTILHGRSVLYRHDGDWINYERAPDEVEKRAGPCLIVSGTKYAKADGNEAAIFAHPDHKPTFLDYRTMTIHPCDYQPEPPASVKNG
jgi:hypothetical protein